MAKDRQKPPTLSCIQGDLPNQCTLDHQSLKQAFFQAFDPSLVRQFCIKRLADPALLPQQAVAGGTHFYCFKLARPGAPMDLAIKIPTPTFSASRAKELKKLLLSLATQTTPGLLGPFELIDCDGQFAIAMPFGPQDAKHAKDDWQPLALWVSQLQEHLALRRLEINDLVQIRCWRGIPFLIDYSDLRSTEGGSRL